MGLLYPTFLSVLAAVAIPLIIHLFNFRKYKRIPFTNVRWLTTVQEETKSKSRWKHILILAFRMLAIFFLVMSFAQPYFAKQNATVVDDTPHNVVYIDPSYSMRQEGGNGNLFNAANQGASELISSASQTARWSFIGTQNKSTWYNADDALERLTRLSVDGSLITGQQLIQSTLSAYSTSEATTKRLFIFSDMQKSTFGSLDFLKDSALNITLVPLAANAPRNISVDSVWFENPVRMPNQQEILKVKVTNHGNNDLESIPLRLAINNKQKALTNVSLAKSSAETVELKFISNEIGFIQGEVSIEDFPIQFDNAYRFQYTIPKKRHVLHIHEEGTSDAFERLFNKDPHFTFQSQSIKQLNFSSLSSVDLIICNQLTKLSSGLKTGLKTALKQGGNVLIIPAKTIDLSSYNTALQDLGNLGVQPLDTHRQNVRKITTIDPLYRGVFSKIEQNTNLPWLSATYPTAKTSRNTFPLLISDRNQTLFSRTPLENGTLFYFGIPIQNIVTNFSNHALFVPTMYQVAIYESQRLPLAYRQHEPIALPLPSSNFSDNPPKVLGPGTELIPRVLQSVVGKQAFVPENALQPGFYSLNVADTSLHGLAVNPSLDESDLERYTSEELRAFVEQHNLKHVRIMEFENAEIAFNALDTQQAANSLWYVAMLLSLLFVLLEILTLKLWK